MLVPVPYFVKPYARDTMKLIKTTPPQKVFLTDAAVDDNRTRAVGNLKAELHRLVIAVDELKVRGSITALTAAERTLWSALVILNELLKER
jgi:hypothetical protein